MASKFSGMTLFVNAVAEAVAREINQQAIVAAFEVGDNVEYTGSKMADHGHWIVKSVDDDTNTVTIMRRGSYRMLKCNQHSVRHMVEPERSYY